MKQTNVVCLVGGVGGAKLAWGLAQILPPEQLTFIGNTGDDFEHLGLHISPDLDTVMYTLAGLASKARGWGLEGETWRTIGRVKELGGPAWFNLGDIDLATHLTRTHMLRNGATLTDATAHLFKQLGIAHTLLPMSDQLVPTLVQTADGPQPFQQWFVEQRWQPMVEEVLLPDSARATPAAIAALHKADIVIIAPSNPFLSVDPILNSYPIRPMLEDARAVVAVTPIIEGDAVKGPLGKMLRDWEWDVSAMRVAQYYGALLTGFVYDYRDGTTVENEQLEMVALDTWMQSDDDRIRLAQEVLAFAEGRV